MEDEVTVGNERRLHPVALCLLIASRRAREKPARPVAGRDRCPHWRGHGDSDAARRRLPKTDRTLQRRGDVLVLERGETWTQTFGVPSRDDRETERRKGRCAGMRAMSRGRTVAAVLKDDSAALVLLVCVGALVFQYFPLYSGFTK